MYLNVSKYVYLCDKNKAFGTCGPCLLDRDLKDTESYTAFEVTYSELFIMQ